LSNAIGKNHPNVYSHPEPFTYFMGYDTDGNLKFELWYWTTFSAALSSKHQIALTIFSKLREEKIEAPIPVRKIVKE